MKKKKIAIISICLLFAVLIGWQFISIYTNKGNLTFTICNESGIYDSVEIYIDGNKIVAEKEFYYYSFYKMYITPKNHVAVVKINGEVSEEIKFNAMLFTNIYVDYQGDRCIYGYGTSFYITISKWFIQFLS
jgi:hypothetical protein